MAKRVRDEKAQKEEVREGRIRRHFRPGEKFRKRYSGNENGAIPNRKGGDGRR